MGTIAASTSQHCCEEKVSILPGSQEALNSNIDIYVFLHAKKITSNLPGIILGYFTGELWWVRGSMGTVMSFSTFSPRETVNDSCQGVMILTPPISCYQPLGSSNTANHLPHNGCSLCLDHPSCRHPCSLYPHHLGAFVKMSLYQLFPQKITSKSSLPDNTCHCHSLFIWLFSVCKLHKGRDLKTPKSPNVCGIYICGTQYLLNR